MSHFSRIQTQLREKSLVLKALNDLGYLTVDDSSSIRGFGGQKIAVDIAVKLPFSYDIGFKLQGETYQLIADWIGVRGLDRAKFLNQVHQRYAYHATLEKLGQQGFSVVEEKQEDGAVRILLRRTT